MGKKNVLACCLKDIPVIIFLASQIPTLKLTLETCFSPFFHN